MPEVQMERGRVPTVLETAASELDDAIRRKITELSPDVKFLLIIWPESEDHPVIMKGNGSKENFYALAEEVRRDSEIDS